MISAFVVRCLDSIIPLLAVAEISRPKLVSVAKQAGLSRNWSPTLKTGFLVTWLVYWSPHDKTNKMTCAPSEDSDQPGHPTNLSSCGQRRLIRLGGCPGWSESSLGAHHFVGFVMHRLIIMYKKCLWQSDTWMGNAVYTCVLTLILP